MFDMILLNGPLLSLLYKYSDTSCQGNLLRTSLPHIAKNLHFIAVNNIHKQLFIECVSCPHFKQIYFIYIHKRTFCKINLVGTSLYECHRCCGSKLLQFNCVKARE